MASWKAFSSRQLSSKYLQPLSTCSIPSNTIFHHCTYHPGCVASLLKEFNSWRDRWGHDCRSLSSSVWSCPEKEEPLKFSNILPSSRLGVPHPDLSSFRDAVRRTALLPNGTTLPIDHNSDNDENESFVERSTLIIVTNVERRMILLGKKLRGFGKGKYNGFGGRLESCDLTPAHGARRELMEESNISIPLSIVNDGFVGILRFSFEDESHPHMKVHLFHVDVHFDERSDDGDNIQEYDGNVNKMKTCSRKGVSIDPKKVQQCDEIIPEWFVWSGIPFNRMFADDSVWLTHYLSSLNEISGKNQFVRGAIKMNGWFHFAPGGDDGNNILHHFLEAQHAP